MFNRNESYLCERSRLEYTTHKPGVQHPYIQTDHFVRYFYTFPVILTHGLVKQSPDSVVEQILRFKRYLSRQTTDINTLIPGVRAVDKQFLKRFSKVKRQVVYRFPFDFKNGSCSNGLEPSRIKRKTIYLNRHRKDTKKKKLGHNSKTPILCQVVEYLHVQSKINLWVERSESHHKVNFNSFLVTDQTTVDFQ